MGERLRKFVPRAPRYVLRPNDLNSMRYGLAVPKGGGGIERTILLNLSETGMAFVVERSANIVLGDLIKVEVPVPGADQIAWYGKVVRIEEYEPRMFWGEQPDESLQVKIGIRFEHLPEGHSQTIRRGIEKSFIQAMRDQQYKTIMYYKMFFMQHLFKICMYTLLTLFALGLIYYLSLPGGNYTQERGAPWGERFKF